MIDFDFEAWEAEKRKRQREETMRNYNRRLPKPYAGSAIQEVSMKSVVAAYEEYLANC